MVFSSVLPDYNHVYQRNKDIAIIPLILKPLYMKFRLKAAKNKCSVRTFRLI